MSTPHVEIEHQDYDGSPSRWARAEENGTEHNEVVYLQWCGRILRGAVDHSTETPPEGIYEWVDAPAGERAIDRSVASLRKARACVRGADR